MILDVNIYCDESTHLPNDKHPFMVLGAIVCPVSLARGAANRLVEIKVKHGLPRDFEIKWTKVSPAKLDFYLEIIDFFFDDDDLQFRTVIAPKAQLDHTKFQQTHDDWYYKMMFYLVRNVLPGGAKSYIYLDKKDTRGGRKVQKLHEVVSNANFDFDKRSIKRVQIVESHHVGLMQLADLLIGAVNYANRGLHTSEAKQRLVQRVRERSGKNLTQTTLLAELKFNIFRWRPQEKSY